MGDGQTVWLGSLGWVTKEKMTWSAAGNWESTVNRLLINIAKNYNGFLARRNVLQMKLR